MILVRALLNKQLGLTFIIYVKYEYFDHHCEYVSL